MIRLQVFLMSIASMFAAGMPLQEASAGVMKIPNPTPAAGERFGQNIAVVGGNILVGTPRDQITGGAAYLIDGATGALLQTYTSPGADPINFGSGVAAAADGNVLIQGGDGLYSNLYHINAATGALINTFTDPNPNPGLTGFGRPVVAQGNELLVGAVKSELAGPGFSGAAYLLDPTTGSELQTFQPPTPISSLQFGGALGLARDRVVIGNTGPNTTDEVHVFSASTGALLHTIASPNPSVIRHFFGSRLAVEGNQVLVGARRDDTAGPFTGAAYLFDVTTGDLLQRFLNPNLPPPGGLSFFGNSVAMRGNLVLVGDNNYVGVGGERGAAYLFDATTGDLLQTFLATTADGGFAGTTGMAFLDDDHVVISAFFDNTGAEQAGAVFVFDIVIPEPSTLMLLSTAALCWACRRRDRQRAA